MIEPRSRGVLDPPLSRRMTSFVSHACATQAHSSCPDLIRRSILFARSFLEEQEVFSKKTDCRIKPGNDDPWTMAQHRPYGWQAPTCSPSSSVFTSLIREPAIQPLVMMVAV